MRFSAWHWKKPLTSRRLSIEYVFLQNHLSFSIHARPSYSRKTSAFFYAMQYCLHWDLAEWEITKVSSWAGKWPSRVSFPMVYQLYFLLLVWSRSFHRIFGRESHSFQHLQSWLLFPFSLHLEWLDVAVGFQFLFSHRKERLQYDPVLRFDYLCELPEQILLFHRFLLLYRKWLLLKMMPWEEFLQRELSLHICLGC